MTSWTVAYQAPLSIGFPRQEYWSGLPLLSPGVLPDPGIELRPPALASRSFTTKPAGKPNYRLSILKCVISRFLNIIGKHGL